MSRILLLLALGLVSLTLCLENIVTERDDGKFYKRNNIFILNDRNHPSFVNLYKYVFVYYKDQDGTDEDLEIRGKLEELAIALENITPKAFVAELDLSKEIFVDEKEMGVREIVGIQSTPHYKFYVSMSRGFDYKRDLKITEIVSYVKSKITLSSTEITTMDDFEQNYHSNRPLVTFIGEQGTDNYNAYQETAKLLMYDKNLTFTHVNSANLNPDLASSLGVTGPIKDYMIKVFNPNDNSASYSKPKVDHIELKDFIINAAFSDYATDELHILQEDTFAKILSYHKALLLFCPGTDEAMTKESEQVVNTFLPQLDTIGQSIFVFKASESKKLLNILGLDLTEQPQLWIMDFRDLEKDLQRYKFTGNTISLPLLTSFYNGWRENKLTVYFPPEPSKGGDYENGVLRLDQNIFYDVIRNPDFETMVFFYVDNCDVCDMFMPIYEKVAMELKGVNQIKLAKINMSMNTLQRQAGVEDNTKLPKVMFYPKSHLDTGLEFNSGVQEKDIISFLYKHKTLTTSEDEEINDDL
ncbi:unnamed protein product [Moneuplotes crassus]|uniref:Thioredoxin domain-containing protein n=1 Tax=Euplotes crassus TaxID=5936 RepID=A0AAD1X7Y7_EUPCR|nr:unnamed protein product [Moneuplotes crassus]